MKLPNGERAEVDIRKPRDYVLSPTHPRGKHKARVFAAVLGLTVEDAEDLRQSLLRAARENEAEFREADDFGRRFSLELVLDGPRGAVHVQTGWIIRHDEDFPRFLSCYAEATENVSLD